MSFPTDSIEEFIIFIIVVFLIGIIISFVGGSLISFILWDISNNNGSILLILGLLIMGIIILVYYHDSKNPEVQHQKELKEEFKNIQRKLAEKSLFIDNRILTQIMELSNNSKMFLYKIYGLPNADNETIAIFFAKNFPKGEYDVEQIKKFLYSISSGNLSYATEKTKNEMYYNIKLNIPKILIKEIMARDKYTCQKCEKNILEHKVEYQGFGEKIEYWKKIDVEYYSYISFKKPLTKGGTVTKDNLITVCHDCNPNWWE